MSSKILIQILYIFPLEHIQLLKFEQMLNNIRSFLIKIMNDRKLIDSKMELFFKGMKKIFEII
jgi:hypothetical protein